MAYRVKTSGSGHVIRTYACDSAGTAEDHVFEVRLRSDEHPKFCPQCGFAVDQRSKPRPSKVSIGGKPITRAVDMTYQELERGSAERAAAVNNPNLKITNMKDRLREGDVAAVLPSNAVTGFMADASRKGVNYGWGGGGQMVQFANPTPVPTNTWTGPGHVALSGIQGDQGRTHQNNKMAAAVTGQLNRRRGE